ncbi:hypothetical protein CFR73_11265 [Novacetimonas maltaceti]|nr:hypothetical protein CFR73_11265 [Novacetimonas maltaceti]
MTIVLFHNARPPRRHAGLFFAHPDGKRKQLPQNIPQVKPTTTNPIDHGQGPTAAPMAAYPVRPPGFA